MTVILKEAADRSWTLYQVSARGTTEFWLRKGNIEGQVFVEDLPNLKISYKPLKNESQIDTKKKDTSTGVKTPIYEWRTPKNFKTSN